jgi:hypothetical protein
LLSDSDDPESELDYIRSLIHLELSSRKDQEAYKAYLKKKQEELNTWRGWTEQWMKERAPPFWLGCVITLSAGGWIFFTSKLIWNCNKYKK